MADYLIPNNTTISIVQNAIGSTSSVDKLLPENSDSWETSFVIPHSKSTQPLLQESAENDEGFDSVSKLKILRCFSLIITNKISAYLHFIII